MTGHDLRGAGRLLTGAALTLLLLAGCGGDDDGSDDDAAATADQTGNGTSSTAAEGGGGDGGALSSVECPSAEEVSTALGADVVVDEDAPVTAEGFCPFTSADGSGNVTASITYTPIDVTQDDGGEYEEVSGVGERARWEDITGTLSVWTGDQGLLVGVQSFGTDGLADDKAAAVSLASTLVGA